MTQVILASSSYRHTSEANEIGRIILATSFSNGILESAISHYYLL
jgi:hypothetical protein